MENEITIPSTIKSKYELSKKEEQELEPGASQIAVVRVKHKQSNLEGEEGAYFADKIELGRVIHAQIIETRWAAFQWNQETNKLDSYSYNPKSETFQRIKKMSQQRPQPPGNMYGKEALLWIYSTSQFGRFHFGRWYHWDTARKVLSPYTGDPEVRPKSFALMKTTAEWTAHKVPSPNNPAWHWWVPDIELYEGELGPLGYTLPGEEQLKLALTEFLNPEEPEIDSAAAACGSDSGTAAGEVER